MFEKSDEIEAGDAIEFKFNDPTKQKLLSRDSIVNKTKARNNYPIKPEIEGRS